MQKKKYKKINNKKILFTTTYDNKFLSIYYVIRSIQNSICNSSLHRGKIAIMIKNCNVSNAAKNTIT